MGSVYFPSGCAGLGFHIQFFRFSYFSVEMVKVYKPGRVVIVLQGRFAGRKAIVLKPHDEGTPERPFEHALVAGIASYPRPVTRRMSATTIARRCRVKPFFRNLNMKHMMPTRYSVADLPLDKALFTKEASRDPVKRKRVRNHIRTVFESRYTSGKNRWFFEKLRF